MSDRLNFQSYLAILSIHCYLNTHLSIWSNFQLYLVILSNYCILNPKWSNRSNLNATTGNNVGTANSFSRSDHQHAIDTAAPSTQIPNQSNAIGTSSSLSRADHIHNIPTAAPTTTLSATTTNSDGIANSFSRSDHSHAITTGIPSTQLADQTNATGTSANIARADHIHNIPTATPVSIGNSNSIGVATTFAKSDHVHRGVSSIAKFGGSAEYGDVILKEGNNITITDVAGTFTFSVAAYSNDFIVSNGGGLTANYTGGIALINGTFYTITGSSLLLPDNSSGSIYVDPTTGLVTSNTSTFPNLSMPMAIFTTLTGVITLLTDRRVVFDNNIVFGTSTNDVSASNSAGVANTFSRSDHTHRGVRSINANAGTQEFGNLSFVNGTAITVTDTLGTFQHSLNNTAVTPAVYGSATTVPVVTIDAQGRITNAVNTTITGVSPGGAASNDLSGTYPGPTVARVNGISVNAIALTGQSIIATSATTALWSYIPKTLLITSGSFAASFTAATTICFIAWKDSEFGVYSTRTIVFDYITSADRDMVIQVINDTPSTIGTLTVPAASTSGQYSFTFLNPGSDMTLGIQISKDFASGATPIVQGIYCQLN